MQCDRETCKARREVCFCRSIKLNEMQLIRNTNDNSETSVIDNDPLRVEGKQSKTDEEDLDDLQDMVPDVSTKETDFEARLYSNDKNNEHLKSETGQIEFEELDYGVQEVSIKDKKIFERIHKVNSLFERIGR